MVTIKRWTFCKILAVLLCLFIIGEAHYALAFQNPAGTAAQADPLDVRFQAARTEYFSQKNEDAKATLEKLIADLSAIEGRDTLKGAVYLLAGANYEKLDFKELSIKYFCRAKAILGEGKTIEGLDLKKLKYYGASCSGGSGAAAGVVTSGSGRGFFGSVFSFLLFSAIAGGLIWYLFFSPNAPFKKKTESTTPSTPTYTSTCFSTHWSFDMYSEWEGSAGTVTLTPSDVAPQPNQSNGWDDSVTYTVSTSGGGTLRLIRVTLSVNVAGGDNGRRHDLAYMDGVQILDQTNTFTEPCSTPGSRDYANIYQRNSTGSFTLRHKVELSAARNVAASVRITRK
jgi:hypothetical protein